MHASRGLSAIVELLVVFVMPYIVPHFNKWVRVHVPLFSSVTDSGGATKFKLGATAQGVWGTEVTPSAAQEQSEVLRSRSSLHTLFTDFDCRNDQNLKFSAQFTPWFLANWFHGDGAKRHFPGA